MNLLEQIAELFKGHESAFRFLTICIQYFHAIDDTIDEKFDREKFIETHYLASLVFSSEYFTQHKNEVGSCFHSILNVYATSVKWENSDKEELKEYANVIRHCGIEMILKVILIEFGWEKQREIDELLREKVFKS